MIELKEGMLLYHGSYAEVSRIDLFMCSPGKDFGRGFYLTASRIQAHHFVPSSIRKYSLEWNRDSQLDFSKGMVSVFRLHLNSEIEKFIFPEANIEWLHFVAANRSFKIFPTLINEYKKYDVIAGKIANDKTARTINAYIDGLFGGEPGSEIADRMALELLLPNKLEDQYCFLTEKSVSALEFIGSEPYEPAL